MRRNEHEPENSEAESGTGKNDAKISALQARNQEIDSTVEELENLDIIGMVRSCGITPEMLARFIQDMKKNPLPVLPDENETKEDGNDGSEEE